MEVSLQDLWIELGQMHIKLKGAENDIANLLAANKSLAEENQQLKAAIQLKPTQAPDAPTKAEVPEKKIRKLRTVSEPENEQSAF